MFQFCKFLKIMNPAWITSTISSSFILWLCSVTHKWNLTHSGNVQSFYLPNTGWAGGEAFVFLYNSEKAVENIKTIEVVAFKRWEESRGVNSETN